MVPRIFSRGRHGATVRVIETARTVAELYGFSEMATPDFRVHREFLPGRSGEHTDIVAKEMYTFTDRGGREVTLRPENTAGVVRAVISNASPRACRSNSFIAGRCSATSSHKRSVPPIPPDRASS